MIVAMRFKIMHRYLTVALCGLFGITTSISATELQEVASFPHQQVTGVAVSKSGRVFVNFPNWSDEHTISVAELVDGKPKAFPNDDWNKAGAAESHFVCVQSVYVDPNGRSLDHRCGSGEDAGGSLRAGPSWLKSI